MQQWAVVDDSLQGISYFWLQKNFAQLFGQGHSVCVQPQSESALALLALVGVSTWEQAAKRKTKGTKKSFFTKNLGLGF